jgi:cytoskeletal protein RodZ
MVDSLGIWLRRTREARQLDLQDAEQALRIRRRYLQALEVGDFEALPGPIQARGFLRNYARYLGLPVEDVLARYDAEVEGHPVQPRISMRVPDRVPRTGERTWAPPPPTIEEEVREVRANSSGSLLRILLGALIFFGLVAVGSLAWLQFEAGRATPAPPITPKTGVAEEAGVTSPTATPTVISTPSFPVSPEGVVRVRLVPRSHAWISISADSQVVFQGVAETSQVLEAEADEMLIVSTGNGGAFDLTINGTDWGVLGDQGQVVRRAWTPQGEVSLEDL